MIGDGIVHELLANKLAEWEMVASVEDTELASDAYEGYRGYEANGGNGSRDSNDSSRNNRRKPS